MDINPLDIPGIIRDTFRRADYSSLRDQVSVSKYLVSWREKGAVA